MMRRPAMSSCVPLAPAALCRIAWLPTPALVSILGFRSPFTECAHAPRRSGCGVSAQARMLCRMNDVEPNFQALRKEFPVLERKTYLNSGSYGALAKDVKAAFETYVEDRLLMGANWDAWIAKLESVRALTATLLRAVPDEIAVTASV